jgi:mannose-6-phosphate isomerase-like protein (cupin superfamily)
MTDTVERKIPPISGAIGMSHLKVYTTEAPDGLRGGCPHMHFTCTETYVVLGGRGSVQALGYGGFEEVLLETGQLMWYTPGVIHRLINQDGKLELLVIMQNAGLPEAGDHVLSFPPEVLADREAYLKAASLATAEGLVYAGGEEAAFRRRDLAVQGFNLLRERVEREGPSAMADFYRQAVEIVRANAEHWRHIWDATALATVRETEDHLRAVVRGETGHLHEGRVYTLPSPGDARKLGFCGWLSPYDLEGTVCRL